MKKHLIAIFTLMLAFLSIDNIFGYDFPDGSVQGLPQNLIVMDENGHSPEDGELYIYIENMIPYEVYKKNITIMNARDDAVYAVYMAAKPNYNSGDIDLLGETVCRLYLDGKLIYKGLVNGDGEPNMQETPLDLGGIYKSGESRQLYAEFIWQPDFNEENDTDNAYHGEVSFHWIFSASVTEPDDETDTSSPNDSSTPKNPSKTTSGGGGGGGKAYVTDGSGEDEENSPHTRVPAHYEEYGTLNDEDKADTAETSATAATESETEETTEGVFEKLVEKIPLLPEDVKTGYKDELIFFIKGAVCAFGLAVVILAIIIHKSIKLKRLKAKGEEAKL